MKITQGIRRKIIQIAAFGFSNSHIGNFAGGRLYKGSWKNFCNPGMNCYSCPAASFACPIGAMQAVGGSAKFSVSFYVLGFVLALGVIFGRAICGFICPFGLIQELLHKIPSPKKRIYKPLTYIKYVMLAVFVLIMPALVTDDFGLGAPAFCEFICPAGTLEGGIPLLLTHPELKHKIRLISTMGGGLRNGNWTSAAEFNLLNDPEAAYIEYHSGVPVQMCGLDVTEQAIIYPEEWEKIRALHNPVAETVAGWLDFFQIKLKDLGWEGVTLHDPCAVLSLVHPEIFEMHDYYVEIVLDGEYTRGLTMADYKGTTGNKPNCTAVTGIDREKFVECLIEACSRFGGKETV